MSDPPLGGTGPEGMKYKQTKLTLFILSDTGAEARPYGGEGCFQKGD